MEIEKYEALMTAIECGSLASAAEKLGYTTSGMSRMMAALEEESGMNLLIRSKNGVRATVACQEIMPEIRQMLTTAQALKKKSASMKGEVVGKIRIGTAYSYFYGDLAECLAEFKAQNPGMTIEIVHGYSTELAEKLDQHELDLCIISKRDFHGRWMTVLRDEMVAVVSSANPLAQKKAFPISACAVQPYIFTYPNADSDSARTMNKNGVVPNIRYTTRDSLATLSMVRADLGMTLINQITTRGWENEGITALPLRPRQMIEIGIGLTEDASPAILEFAETLFHRISDINQGPMSL